MQARLLKLPLIKSYDLQEQPMWCFQRIIGGDFFLIFAPFLVLIQPACDNLLTLI